MTSEVGHVPQSDSSESIRDMNSDRIIVEHWHANDQEAGLQLDPETAKVRWEYAWTLNLHGDDPDLLRKSWHVGRDYFACAPGSDIWVSFDDLPEATRDVLWQKLSKSEIIPDHD